MMNALDYNLGNDPSLLILDDDEPFTRTLGRAMERRGFEVKTLLTVKAVSYTHLRAHETV